MLGKRSLKWGGFILFVLFIITIGCSEKEKEVVQAFITPDITLSDTELPIGSPLEMSYQWMIDAQMPPLQKDYTVFVHFLDQEGELVFTDDHAPPLPTSQWKPGEQVEYVRTPFIPYSPIVGELKVKVGLYHIESGTRLTLVGKDEGKDKAYLVGKIKLFPEDLKSLPVYKDGWYDLEVASDDTLIKEWIWSQKDAEVSFVNPRRDAILYFHAYSPADELGSPQQISLYLNDQPLESWQCTSSEDFLRKITIKKEKLGKENWIDIRIEVDKAFIPVEHIEGSEDTRELGVKVYNLLLKPASATPAAKR